MSRKFTATPDAISVPLVLGVPRVTVAYWFFVPSWTNNDSRIFYSSKDGSVFTINGFFDNPSRNSAPNSGTSNTAMTTSAGVDWEDSYPRPSAGAWHHIMVTHDRTVPINTVDVDGARQTLTTTQHGSAAAFTTTQPNFTNCTVTFGKYGSTFIPCNLAEWAIWSNVILTNKHAQALAAGANPAVVHHENLLCYLPFFGADSPEPDYSGSRTPGTVTSTTFAPHPPVQPGLIVPRRGPQPTPI